MKPELPEDTIYHVGVSGGKDSGAVLLWMVHKSGIPREKINATFCDTGNEHEYTYEQVQMLSEKVHPIEVLQPVKPFFDLCLSKGSFPSAKRRFCTQVLKIHPSQDHIGKLLKEHEAVVAVSGVRANESHDRSKLPEWDYSGELLTYSWRPILSWTIEDVIAIHEEYGVPMNKLYAMGARRVGCWPCVMSVKAEIRNIALNFPERIEQIRKLEADIEGVPNGVGKTFFAYDKVPERFRTKPYITKDGQEIKVACIDDVVRWSMTGKGAKGHYLDEPQEPIGCSSGFCE